MAFADIARRVGKLAIDHSPTLLTSIGVAGVVSTAFLAGKASFEASDIIRLKEGVAGTHGDPREALKERIKLTWKLYIPAATTGVAAIVCIIGANKVGARRAAGLAAATTIIEKSFDEYKTKVIEKLGERKENAIHDEIAQDRVDMTYLDDVKIYGLGEGELCYDQFSDRYFRGSVEGIRKAENDLNYALLHDNYASLDEFYQLIGLPSPTYAHNIGWNSDRMLEIRISTVLAHGNKPCLTMSFKNEPGPDYGRFHG